MDFLKSIASAQFINNIRLRNAKAFRIDGYPANEDGGHRKGAETSNKDMVPAPDQKEGGVISRLVNVPDTESCEDISGCGMHKSPSYLVNQVIAQAHGRATAASLRRYSRLTDASDATTRVSECADIDSGSLSPTSLSTPTLAPREYLLDDTVSPVLHSDTSTDLLSHNSNSPINDQPLLITSSSTDENTLASVSGTPAESLVVHVILESGPTSPAIVLIAETQEGLLLDEPGLQRELSLSWSDEVDAEESTGIDGMDFMPVGPLCTAGLVKLNEEDAWMRIPEGALLESFSKYQSANVPESEMPLDPETLSRPYTEAPQVVCIKEELVRISTLSLSPPPSVYEIIPENETNETFVSPAPTCDPSPPWGSSQDRCAQSVNPNPSLFPVLQERFHRRAFVKRSLQW
ncbi:hypothetical protein ONZ45_g11399 [Pleurotus djamor]|nr:hypothetical protein ONZ45_g11399 [Pleurotus djamor]